MQKNRPGLSFAQAWEVAKGENPELFQGEKEQAPAPKAGNELASRARALAIDQTVKAIQAGCPRFLTMKVGISLDLSTRICLGVGCGKPRTVLGPMRRTVYKKLTALIERRNNSGPVKVIGIRQEI